MNSNPIDSNQISTALDTIARFQSIINTLENSVKQAGYDSFETFLVALEKYRGLISVSIHQIPLKTAAEKASAAIDSKATTGAQIPKATRPGLVSDDEARRMKEMMAQGMTYREITRETGRQYPTIKKALERAA